MTYLDKAIKEARRLIKPKCVRNCAECEIETLCDLIEDLSLNGSDCCPEWLEEVKE